jgi:hypothetical protein
VSGRQQAPVSAVIRMTIPSHRGLHGLAMANDPPRGREQRVRRDRITRDPAAERSPQTVAMSSSDSWQPRRASLSLSL